MKTSIETINGQLCTLVWHQEPRNAEWVEEHCYQVGYELFIDHVFEHIATALPALPRNPTKADAPLLYRYAAEEVYPSCRMDDGQDSIILHYMRHSEFAGEIWAACDKTGVFEHADPIITHATDSLNNIVDIAIVDVNGQLCDSGNPQRQGNRVEIAIKESE